MKKTVLTLLLLLLSACGNFYDVEYKYGDVVCTDQQLWDYRTSYDNFDCEMFETSDYRVRECFAEEKNVSFHKDGSWSINVFKKNTTCIEPFTHTSTVQRYR